MYISSINSIKFICVRIIIVESTNSFVCAIFLKIFFYVLQF